MQLCQGCSLLGPDRRCRVNAVHPIACRAFTSDSATGCNAFVFGAAPGGAIDQNPARYRLHSVATDALQRAARRRGAPSAQRGLCDSLLEALNAAADS